jgi:NAD(P)-dependent dehydrogenase (short-subunit alcohol dehydrogenase family)
MPTVLVTGAGRGIDAATALRLAATGWDVHAGVRREHDGATLVEQSRGRVRVLRLDITSAEDIAALDERLPTSLDGVVNNAGIAVGGPVEALALDEIRRQFEVNLIGQVAVTQAVLPRLRVSRGRVVFVSSLSGRVAAPMTGAYSASKFALEGLADTLRLELRPWRVRVSLIEPAQTDTDMWRGADAALEEAISTLTPEHRALYAKHIDGMRKMIPRVQRAARSPEGAAAAIERALTDRRARARYVVGSGPRAQAALSRLTPTPLLDAGLREVAGVPRQP